MSFSTRTMADADWAALQHFHANEFAAPDKMGVEFMRWLDTVRTKAGVPMHITSSYRTPQHNIAVGGAADSAHCDMPCNAADIGKSPTPDDPNWNRGRYAIVTAALALGCTRIGIYADGSIHLDRTDPQRPANCLWHVVDNPAH